MAAANNIFLLSIGLTSRNCCHNFQKKAKIGKIDLFHVEISFLLVNETHLLTL